MANALQDYEPKTDVAIELGGEDAKIIYFNNGIEQRMNGVCHRVLTLLLTRWPVFYRQMLPVLMNMPVITIRFIRLLPAVVFSQSLIFSL